jgi:hypothetical protein
MTKMTLTQIMCILPDSCIAVTTVTPWKQKNYMLIILLTFWLGKIDKFEILSVLENLQSIYRTPKNGAGFTRLIYTRLFEMIVGVLTTCHTQYTWDSIICVFLFNRTTPQVFVTYLTGALYVHPLWFYKHQHDNEMWAHITPSHCRSPSS